jgi:UDP-N-acetylenolpyruvoylglucosamine reductase
MGDEQSEQSNVMVQEDKPMFGSLFANSVGPARSIVGTASLLQSAIAYSTEIDGTSVTVSDDCGVIVLEGTAPMAALSKIAEIVANMVGDRVCNLVQPL